MRRFLLGRRILMLGGGFKAAYCAHLAQRHGAEIVFAGRGFERRGTAFELLHVADRVEALETLDIRDGAAVQDVLKRYAPEWVINFAADAQVPRCRRDPCGAFETNTLAPLRLLEACGHINAAKQTVSVLCLISTDHVFGNQEFIPVPETQPLRRGGVYDTSKVAMEWLVESMIEESCQATLPRVVVTRCANVYGPGDVAERRVLPAFAKAAIQGAELPLLCRETRRQFIHVADAVWGYLLACDWADRRAQRLSHFHFGNRGDEYDLTGLNTADSAVAIGDLAAYIAQHYGGFLPAKQELHLPHENRQQALCCEATRQTLGWRPTRSVAAGIEGLVQWYRGGRHVFELVPAADEFFAEAAA